MMEPEHKAVRYDDDQEQIAVLAMRLNMLAVPVVDGEKRLIGAVPSEALFGILLVGALNIRTLRPQRPQFPLSPAVIGRRSIGKTIA